MTYNDSNRLHANRKVLAEIFSKIKVSTVNFHKGTPCWEWTGMSNSTTGYGLKKHKGQVWSAHRFIYCVFVEHIQLPLECDHLCRNRICVSPIHIEAVTHKENQRRGNSVCGVNGRKTHCKRGHEFTPENTYLLTRGERVCVACDKIRKSQTPRKPLTEPQRKRHIAYCRKWHKRRKLQELYHN